MKMKRIWWWPTEDFDNLLSEIHKRKNMKLIIDLVVNHTSDEHDWMV